MRGWFLLIVLVVIAAVDVLVPYLFIGDTPSFAASYLFWCVITLVVVAIFGFVYTARWGRARTDNAAAGGDPGAPPDSTPGAAGGNADGGRGGDRGAAPDSTPGTGAGRDTGGRA